MNVRDYRAEQAAAEAAIDALPDYTMRAPCRWCGEASRGKGPRLVSGQAAIHCAVCRRVAYNAPKAETGAPVRSISSRPDLKPGQRQRILDRDQARCQICGRTPAEHGVILHVGHILSVKEGREQGASDGELFADCNLFACCEECNIDTGALSMPPIMWLRLIRAQLARRA